MTPISLMELNFSPIFHWFSEW